ncbi:hypothetical protein ARMGADRAFT_1040744 [Armillaria gallica]|uniref:Uncharacterized protein n=1 Tax=Armillaria gallica TaxID=47427 RepID=A0A2H3CTT9_ARMGA|nr:hypothetical protein ARMGADRAFT_1040744 [Armillaria gallica]
MAALQALGHERDFINGSFGLSLSWGSHLVIGHFPGNKDFMEPLLPSLKPLPCLQCLWLIALENDFYTAIECIESIRNNEPLLMGLHIIVSTSRQANIKFAAGVSEWDVDDVEPDVLLDSPWEFGS